MATSVTRTRLQPFPSPSIQYRRHLFTLCSPLHHEQTRRCRVSSRNWRWNGFGDIPQIVSSLNTLISSTLTILDFRLALRERKISAGNAGLMRRFRGWTKPWRPTRTTSTRTSNWRSSLPISMPQSKYSRKRNTRASQVRFINTASSELGPTGRAKLVNMFGPRCFDEGSDQVGNFWTIITTRPYMSPAQTGTPRPRHGPVHWRNSRAEEYGRMLRSRLTRRITPRSKDPWQTVTDSGAAPRSGDRSASWRAAPPAPSCSTGRRWAASSAWHCRRRASRHPRTSP